MRILKLFSILLLILFFFAQTTHAQLIDWNKRLKIKEYKGQITDIDSYTNEITIQLSGSDEIRKFKIADEERKRLKRGMLIVIKFSQSQKSVVSIDILQRQNT